MPQLLKAVDLITGYREPVLGPISFTVDSGEIIGIWGANGIGKSTLLKAIGGEAKVFSGELIQSKPLALGYQTQQPVKLNEIPMTGREYLRFAQANDESPPEKLSALLDQRIDQLSGGQFQLISLWAVLGSHADLVLLDEPTNNLDPASEQFLAELLRSEQGKRSVLLVSHEREFLRQSCDRVLEIEA